MTDVFVARTKFKAMWKLKAGAWARNKQKSKLWCGQLIVKPLPPTKTVEFIDSKILELSETHGIDLGLTELFHANPAAGGAFGWQRGHLRMFAVETTNQRESLTLRFSDIFSVNSEHFETSMLGKATETLAAPAEEAM